jgi:hypothetical protein
MLKLKHARTCKNRINKSEKNETGRQEHRKE